MQVLDCIFLYTQFYMKRHAKLGINVCLHSRRSLVRRIVGTLGILEMQSHSTSTEDIQTVYEQTRSRSRRQVEASQKSERHSNIGVEGFICDCYFQLFFTKYI